MSGLLKRLGHGSTRYGLGDMLRKGMAFLLVPVYTRYLSPADYGIVAVITAISSVLAVLFGFGMRASVVRHYYDFADDPEEVRSYMGSVFLFYLLGGGMLAILLYLLGPWIGAHAFQQVPFHPFISLTIWTAYVSAGGAILLGLYRAREQSGRYVLVQAGGSIFTLLLVVLFIVGLGRGVVGYVEGSALAALVLAVIYLSLVWGEVRWRLSITKVRAALVFGLPLVPHLLAGSVTAVFDRLVLERFVPLGELGVYMLGYQIGMIVGFAATAVNSAWTPIFYDTARKRDDAPEVIARLTTLYAIAIVLGGSCVALFGREVIALVAPDTYAGAERVTPIVAAAYCFQGLYFMSVTPLFYAKRTKIIPFISGTSALLTVILLFVLVPPFGVMGAAWATLAAFAAQWVITVAVARSSYAIPYDYGRLAGTGALFLLVMVAEAATRDMTGVAAWSAEVGTLALLLTAMVALRIIPVRRWSRIGEWLDA